MLKKVVFFVLYVLTGYRRRVVITNLKNAFPTKSNYEIHQISKKYYRFLSELIVESLFCLIYPAQVIKDKCKVTDQAMHLFNYYYQNKQNIIIVLGHWGNWELAGLSFSLSVKQKLNVIYHPIKNRFFNNLIKYIRERFGASAVPMNQVFKEMINRKNEVNATIFIADQSPQPDGAVWCNFLNQDTPFFRGPGILAQKFKLPVVYANIVRVQNGYYNITAETLFETSDEISVEKMIEIYAKRLEKDILDAPQYWIWSHKRWKHKRTF
jgi:KDO2-lipid IV(A) lauroyltransferase